MTSLLRSTALLALLAGPAFAQQADTPTPPAQPESAAPETEAPETPPPGATATEEGSGTGVSTEEGPAKVNRTRVVSRSIRPIKLGTWIYL